MNQLKSKSQPKSMRTRDLEHGAPDDQSRRELPWSRQRKQPRRFFQISGHFPNGFIVPDSPHDGLSQTIGLMQSTTMLLSAVRDNNIAVAKYLVGQLTESDRGARLMVEDISGNGILQIAALHDLPEMFQMLLSINRFSVNAVDVNAVDANHGTALQAAIYMDSKHIIDLLLPPAMSLTKPDFQVRKGLRENAIGIASVGKMPLITPPVDVNVIGGYLGTSLQVAAFRGCSDLVERLVEAGADVCISGGKYGFALQAAARTGLLPIVQLILNATPVHANDGTVVLQPSEEQKRKAIERLVNLEGGKYLTALQAACKGPYTGATTFLRHLSCGRVLNEATGIKRARIITPEHKEQYFEVAKLLVSYGAKVNVVGGKLQSSINAAASAGDCETLQLLLKFHREDAKHDNEMCSRALISAISFTIFNNVEKSRRIRLQMVDLLVNHNADIRKEIGSSLFNRPLTAAAARNDVGVMSYILRKAGNAEEQSHLMNYESGIYGSALRAALSVKATEAAEWLIIRGAELHPKDSEYSHLLHVAVFSKMDGMAELIISKGVDVDVMDDCGQTSLHIASYLGLAKLTKLLLEKGADPERKDAWGDTPLKIANRVLGRGSHPLSSLEDLRKVKQELEKKFKPTIKYSSNTPFKGPPLKPVEAIVGRTKPVFATPIWNPGLGFRGTVVDFLEKDEEENFVVSEQTIDNLLYRMKYTQGRLNTTANSAGAKRRLRWIHLPANNMTWCEMLVKNLWSETHSGTTCKSFWGTDPYYVSPDLAPHARFVTPQCDRLISDSFANQQADLKAKGAVKGTRKDTLFVAFPIIHWEACRGQQAVAKLLEQIREDSRNTRLLRAGETWDTSQLPPLTDPKVQNSGNQSSNLAGKSMDDELLIKYLFKKYPIHLRRTLDQYFYSYLADTRVRDTDQVVTRSWNTERQKTMVEIETLMKKLEKRLGGKEYYDQVTLGNASRATSNSPEVTATNVDTRKFDDDSPMIMIDQVWLWVLDNGESESLLQVQNVMIYEECGV
jgi:ankyrin repeat protein